jgi:hypothetical protein
MIISQKTKRTKLDNNKKLYQKRYILVFELYRLNKE